MKKFVLCLCTFAGLTGVFGLSPAARADVGPNDDDGDYGYQPRYRRHEEYRDVRHDEGYAHCRPQRVYVVERDYPVRRDVYFEPSGRCFYPAGRRRVYVEDYSREYPRFRHHHRPHVGVSFSFGG